MAWLASSAPSLADCGAIGTLSPVWKRGERVTRETGI